MKHKSFVEEIKTDVLRTHYIAENSKHTTLQSTKICHFSTIALVNLDYFIHFFTIAFTSKLQNKP